MSTRVAGMVRLCLQRSQALRFEDEPYVRVYKRKTNTWHKLGEEGRTVWFHLLLELDRAGILECDQDDPEDAVQTVCRLSERTVRIGLAKLLERKCLVWIPERRCLFAPNFMAAQEAKQSNALKQKIKRDRSNARSRMLKLVADPAIAALVDYDDLDDEEGQNDCDTRGVAPDTRGVGTDTRGVANNRSHSGDHTGSAATPEVSHPTPEVSHPTPEVSHPTLCDTQSRSSRSSRSDRSDRLIDPPLSGEEAGQAVSRQNYQPAEVLVAEYRAAGLGAEDIASTLDRYRERGVIEDAPQASHDRAFESWLEKDLERVKRKGATGGRRHTDEAGTGNRARSAGAGTQSRAASAAPADPQNGGRPARRDSPLNARLRAKQSLLRLPPRAGEPER